MIDVSTIADMLASRIEPLCCHLLPNGTRDGVEWRVGSLAGERGKSMAVRIKGSKPGVWSDFSSGEAGDALDLVAGVLFRGDKAEAIKWAKSWLGIDDMDPARLEQRRREVEAESARKAADAKAEEEKKRKSARALWFSAQPDIRVTPVYQYLLGRGIDINVLPRLPGALRYNARTYCHEAKEAGAQEFMLPAMVAAIINSQGEQISTHRTYIEKQPDGGWKKAKLKDAKKTLAQYAGGFISLNRGASGKPIKDAPDDDHLIIAEGIEDGLSLALGCPEKRVIAGVSVSNMQNLHLPETISRITLAVDNDGEGAQSAAAVDAAISRFMNEGREVFIARSPVGKDFNDLLQAQRDLLLNNAVRV